MRNLKALHDNSTERSIMADIEEWEREQEDIEFMHIYIGTRTGR